MTHKGNSSRDAGREAPGAAHACGGRKFLVTDGALNPDTQSYTVKRSCHCSLMSLPANQPMHLHHGAAPPRPIHTHNAHTARSLSLPPHSQNNT